MYFLQFYRNFPDNKALKVEILENKNSDIILTFSVSNFTNYGYINNSAYIKKEYCLKFINQDINLASICDIIESNYTQINKMIKNYFNLDNIKLYVILTDIYNNNQYEL